MTNHSVFDQALFRVLLGSFVSSLASSQMSFLVSSHAELLMSPLCFLVCYLKLMLTVGVCVFSCDLSGELCCQVYREVFLSSLATLFVLLRGLAQFKEISRCIL